ncbi:MAG: HEAT repeat domain-containing protein [Planctomycetota bacterium]
MKIALVSGIVAAFVLGGCVSEGPYDETRSNDDGFLSAGPLLEKEIEERIANMPYYRGLKRLANLMRLADIGEPAIPYLIEGLKNEDSEVRAASVYALGLIDDKRVLPEIRASLEDPDRSVQLEAAASLLGMGDWKGVPHLIRAIDDPDRYVRYKSFEALNKFTGLSFQYDFRASQEDRSAAVAKWQTWWGEKQEDDLLAGTRQ